MNCSHWWKFTEPSEEAGRANGTEVLRKCMNAILQFVVKHGYTVFFGAVFARRIGLAVPEPAFLLAAGALRQSRAADGGGVGSETSLL